MGWKYSAHLGWGGMQLRGVGMDGSGVCELEVGWRKGGWPQ
jgi:hypothetical protein